ncbi:MAG: hypothetical protein IPP77_05970 [Bacteroidetes bacterium]|nr:hypothetical protein [Bacteroidota bacterium]
MLVDKSKLKIISGENLNKYFPAHLLPYRDKDEFTMPLPHFYKMQFYFSSIETLIVIGWKGNEASFVEQLLQHARKVKKVIKVDPEPESVKKNLVSLISRDYVVTKIYNSFESFVMSNFEKDLN